MLDQCAALLANLTTLYHNTNPKGDSQKEFLKITEKLRYAIEAGRSFEGVFDSIEEMFLKAYPTKSFSHRSLIQERQEKWVQIVKASNIILNDLKGIANDETLSSSWYIHD